MWQLGIGNETADMSTNTSQVAAACGPTPTPYARDDSRGARHLAPFIAPQPCIRWIHWDPDHDATMRIGGEAPGRRAPFQLTHAGPLDLFDLVLDEPKARHVAAQFAKRVRWHRHVLRRTQRLETLRRIAQFWIEAPDAETGQTGFQPAHDACALAN